MDRFLVERAAVFFRPHIPVSIEELELEPLRDGKVRLDIVAAGVCQSDYHLIDGHRKPRATPWVMGHGVARVDFLWILDLYRQGKSSWTSLSHATGLWTRSTRPSMT
jgi:hypothetical protein